MGQSLKFCFKGDFINENKNHFFGNIMLIKSTTDVMDLLYSTDAELDIEFFHTKTQHFASQTKEKTYSVKAVLLAGI